MVRCRLSSPSCCCETTCDVIERTPPCVCVMTSSADRDFPVWSAAEAFHLVLHFYFCCLFVVIFVVLFLFFACEIKQCLFRNQTVCVCATASGSSRRCPPGSTDGWNSSVSTLPFNISESPYNKKQRQKMTTTVKSTAFGCNFISFLVDLLCNFSIK